jgi:hypothetical protein
MRDLSAWIATRKQDFESGEHEEVTIDASGEAEVGDFRG